MLAEWTQGVPVRTFGYDSAGRLTTATVFTLTTRFRYNGLGQRIAVEVVGRGTTTVTLDTAAGGRILAERTVTGTTTYLYGHDCVGEQRSNEWLYYLSDASGTVRQGADARGYIKGAWRFSPSGTLIEGPQGMVSHLICGGVYDQSTGLIYKGGRYFDPNLGIWLALTPLVVVQAWRGPRKRRRWALGVSLGLLALCAGSTLTGCCPPSNPTSIPTPLCTEAPTRTPTHTPTPTDTLVPTPSGKTAYLTFDDGPDPAITPQIARELQSRGVVATFFLTGADPGDTNDPNSSDGWQRIYSPDGQTGQSVVSVIHSAGHAIGVHGWRHDHPWNTFDAAEEVRMTEQALKSILGDSFSAMLLRAPGGAFPAEVISEYASSYYYGWDIPSMVYNGLDGYGMDGGTVVARITEELEASGYPDQPIILLHSIHEGTLAAIRDQDLIGTLRNLGYTSFGVLPRPGDHPGYPPNGAVVPSIG